MDCWFAWMESFGLNTSAENVEMIRRLQEVYARHLIPVTDVIHGKSRKRSLDGRDAFGFKRIDEVPAIVCSVCASEAAACIAALRRVCARLAGLGCASGRPCSLAQPSSAQKIYPYEPLMMDPVLHDLCQRRLLFGRQGLEGAGRAAKSAAEEELRADERPAGHSAFRHRPR